MSLMEKLSEVLDYHESLVKNPARKSLIKQTVDRGEAFVSKNGALSTWTPPESTARTPKDTVIVKRETSQRAIDWASPNNLPIDEKTFDRA
ncbi:phosphoenolpyruvate carboxykinase (ATP), partial [Candidatus Bipolaricaulota bacterium]|nr:phosphoenolpyruvate carboxykinase (ATP) [Candidatus Bipolaricaulota bacterium]